MAKAPSTRNITKVFREATPDQIQSGMDWYADAHRIAGILAERYGVTLEVAAGVIAALSPLNSWGSNVSLAARFLEAGGLEAGYLKANLAKARAILAGADIVPTLSGLKVTNFYRSIVSKGADGLCVDRHAAALALNDRSISNDMPKLTPKRYDEFVAAYARAAKIVSRELGTEVTPAVVQSVTWVVWRAKFWSAGAFDSHSVS
jgi:hypothetical protein